MPKNKGFTLLELVIVLSILSLVMTFLYSTLVHTTQTVKKVELHIKRQHQIRTLFEGIIKELRLVSDSTPPLILSAKETDTANQLPVFFECSNKNSNNSLIKFIIPEGGVYLPGRQNSSGMVQVSYRLEREEQTNRLLLIRDELPVIHPAKLAYDKLLTFPVNRIVRDFRVRLYDSSKKIWVSEWGLRENSNENQGEEGIRGTGSKVPGLIEISIDFEMSEGVIRSYTTVIGTTAGVT